MEISIEKDFEIKNLSTFKIGGKIEKVYLPKSVEEFCEILKSNPNIKVFGNLSNTLISTDGYKGEIVLTKELNSININGTKVIVDCGVKGPKLAQVVAEKGLSGFEFLIGFPGSIGGEICMNASANGQCISDYLISVLCYSEKLGCIKLSKEEMDFAYRKSRCQCENLIVLQAEFNLTTKNPEEIQQQMKANIIFRKEHQPSLALPNCGSIFKNPENDSAGRLLDSVGAKELVQGGVKVWENHANFIVNHSNGTSLDILRLMYNMYSKVKERYNIELEPEIRFLGGENKEENELCKILYKVK